jgi:methoxymalonate biosynthesis acyl carrier protein
MLTDKKLEIIRRFFSERGPIIDDDLDLFESGVIDSMTVIELIVYLEKQLETHLNAETITMDNFRTIKRIFSLVGR